MYKMAGFDAISPIIGNTVQLSLKFSDTQVTLKIVQKLLGELAGFHLKTPDFIHLAPTNKTPTVNYLPNFKTLEETNQYAIDNMQPNVQECLGTIAANEDTILFSINHVCGDGGYFKGIIDHINDPPKKLENLFPVSALDAFNHLIEKFKHIEPIFINEDKELTTVKPFGPKKGNERLDFVRYPVNTLACYNKEKGVCNFLNESTCMSFIMSHIVADGRNQTLEEMEKRPYGIQILMDLRKRSRIPVSLNSFDWFSSFNIHAHPKLDMKMSEIYAQLRQDLREKALDERCFHFIRAMDLEDKTPAHTWDNKVFINNSNIGQIMLKDPLKDALLTVVNHKVPFRNMSPLMTYSLTDQHGRNEFVQTLRHHSNGIPEKYAKLINNSTKFALQNVHINMTLREALKAIKNYQMTYFH